MASEMTKNMLHRIEVVTKKEFLDAEGDALKKSIAHLNLGKVDDIRVIKVYKLEGIDDKQLLHSIVEKLLVEKLWQDYALDEQVIRETDKAIEVALKPGVMDTEIDSVTKAVSDLGIDGLIAAGTGKRYIFKGNVSTNEVQKIAEQLLMNKTVQYILQKPEETLIIGSSPAQTQTVSMREMSDEQLIELSNNRLWLNLEEMKIIQNHFKKLDRDPTDLEVEMLAQTWSEHCVHKTFKAKLIIDGKEKPSLMSRIKNATKEINSSKVISVFEDNSGVIEFFDDLAVSGKGETHNSPSAIEPYGGAMTGSGGVFRDIVGTGQGAKTIISTDVFCFAPLDLPREKVPLGSIHPRRLSQEIVRGVKDYGNRMGIPTNNGSFHFHPDFVAKPTILVGAYGIMPKKFAKKSKPKKGDLILTAGGKTGRDGIHGATFSSGEMTADTKKVSGSAVQIGNAIEEKRTFDAIMIARDRGLIRAITDCGAGGYSSAVGEMGEELGAVVKLESIDLKYQGLAPWEIWISESQERMVMAVDPKDIKELEKIFSGYNVDIVVIGEFTGDRKLKITWEGQIVCDLEMEFIHNGLPQRTMEGAWREPKLSEPDIGEPIIFAEQEVSSLPPPLSRMGEGARRAGEARDRAKSYNEIFKKVLAHWNVCSKEPIVRRYDHEVMGTSALKPYSGVKKDAPNDAVIVEPVLGSGKGLAVAHGLNPTYNKIHPYWGAASAFDECVRNMVATGVDPENIALLDNFIWPFPEKEELGQLDQAVDACYDITTAWKMPLVSGKDSLSSTYRGPNGKVIKIPPVLCISGFAPVKEIEKTVSSDFKQAGSSIFIIGETKAELGGSVYYDLQGQLGASVPKVDIIRARKIFKTMHKTIQNGLLRSSHDISEGGIGVTIAEMCFGGDMGAKIELEKVSDLDRADHILFSESNTRFVVEVAPEDEGKILELFNGLPISKIGEVSDDKNLKFLFKGKELIFGELNELKKVYKSTMSKYF